MIHKPAARSWPEDACTPWHCKDLQFGVRSRLELGAPLAEWGGGTEPRPAQLILSSSGCWCTLRSLHDAMAAPVARCHALQRSVPTGCRPPSAFRAATFRSLKRSTLQRCRVASASDGATALTEQQATASHRQPVAPSSGSRTAEEPPHPDPEQQPSAVPVSAGSGASPAAAAPAGERGPARDKSLEQEVTELRLLLQQQAEQQAEAVRLIQQQQQTIATLERRLLGGDAGGAVLAAAGSTAAAQRPSETPLDGPAFVMQPSVMDRPVQGECCHHCLIADMLWSCTAGWIAEHLQRLVLPSCGAPAAAACQPSVYACKCGACSRQRFEQCWASTLLVAGAYQQGMPNAHWTSWCAAQLQIMLSTLRARAAVCACQHVPAS